MTRLCSCILFAGVIALLICSAGKSIAQTQANVGSEIDRLAQRAEVDLRNQNPTLAEEEYQKILALDPNNIGAHSNLGVTYYLQKDFARAVEEFRVALRLEPDLWNISGLCGLSEAKNGQNEDAVVHLDQAFQHVAQTSLRLAVGKQEFSILFEAGDLSRAAEVVGQLQRLDPKNVDVLYAAYQVYSLMANRAFLDLAQLQPGSARMYQLRGDKMLQMGNSEGAIAAYRLAIQHDPHLSAAHFALGEVLSNSRSSAERAEAESEYQKALDDNPLDEKAECRLGDIDLRRSNLLGASGHYKRALQLQPDDPDANEGLGMVLFANGSGREAHNYLNRAVQLDPTDVSAYYHLSQASREAGDLDLAKREMDEFIRLKTDKDRLKRTFSDLSAQTTPQTASGPDSDSQPASVPQAPPEGQDKSVP